MSFVGIADLPWMHIQEHCTQNQIKIWATLGDFSKNGNFVNLIRSLVIEKNTVY